MNPEKIARKRFMMFSCSIISREEHIKSRHESKNQKVFKSDFKVVLYSTAKIMYTVVPALGDPRRERPPAVCGHFVNVPTHLKVKLPLISGHLPNADSHLLVVCTCYNGQCKQMPRFRLSFQPKIAGAHPNLRPTDLSNFHAVVW